MTGTNRSSAGTNNANPGPWWIIGRWSAGVFLLLLGLLIVGLLNRSTSQELRELQRELEDIQKSPSGAELKDLLNALHSSFLLGQVRRNENRPPEPAPSSARIQEWLAQKLSHATSEERPVLDHIANAFPAYLAGLKRLQLSLDKPDPHADQLLLQVQAEYDKLTALCDTLEKISQERLTKGLTEAPQTLQSLRAVSHIAYYVLLGFLIAIAVLFYLVLLQPLKTKLDESQALLERQEKLASLGTLATGVAHEIRNPLTAIKFRLFSLKTTMPDSLAQSEDLDVINNEINRLDRIVKDFLQFARPSEPQFMNVPIAGMFHTIRELLLLQLQKQGIELHIQSPDPALRVRADQHQIEQVLINLVQNAADSIGQNGAITLRARSTSARLVQHLTPAVSIDVIDNGKGIPHDAQRRLFDPFFSTKEGGTGLGLPIAARIAEKHGGFVQHESQPNRGATFTLVLPKPA